VGRRLFGRSDPRRTRDLDRLAFLERLSRGGSARREGAVRTPIAKTPAVARYTRFRQAAGLLIGLALFCLFGSLAGFVLQLVRLFQGEVQPLTGAAGAGAWLIGGAAAYGILKGIGELLFLLSDMGELINSGVEVLWEERSKEQSPEAGGG